MYMGQRVCQVSVPERSKGVDSSSTVFALVGSNPTADISFSFFSTSSIPTAVVLALASPSRLFSSTHMSKSTVLILTCNQNHTIQSQLSSSVWYTMWRPHTTHTVQKGNTVDWRTLLDHVDARFERTYCWDRHFSFSGLPSLPFGRLMLAHDVHQHATHSLVHVE